MGHSAAHADLNKEVLTRNNWLNCKATVTIAQFNDLILTSYPVLDKTKPYFLKRKLMKVVVRTKIRSIGPFLKNILNVKTAVSRRGDGCIPSGEGMQIILRTFIFSKCGCPPRMSTLNNVSDLYIIGKLLP